MNDISAPPADRPDPNPDTRLANVIAEFRERWITRVIGTVDQAEVIERRREDCALSERYLFMTAMSGGIAILGLLLSSPAVVIGAMLLSPLMGPIMGLGFALAIGDWQWLKQSGRSLAWGSLMAVALCSVLVWLSPIQTITTEIAARTRPNLFDLFVALFSALAGAYAMIRGKEGTIVGVAIATALMPPLAVVGFGFATWNWTVFSGALLLFVTNLITIALTAFGMAKLYGFRANLTKGQSQAQSFAVLVVFVMLAMPLAYSLQQIAWETNAQRIVRSEITTHFDGRLSDLSMEFSSTPIRAAATLFTPVIEADGEEAVERILTERLGQPIELSLTQYQVGTTSSAAEQAQLSAARRNEEEADEARMTALATRLSLVAGVSASEVLIDRPRRHALVRARRLPGASLGVYYALEQRITATEPEWTIELIPPSGALPDAIPFDDDGPTDEGARALAVIGWAAARLDRPVVLTGAEDQIAQAGELLSAQGIEPDLQPAAGPLRASWGEDEG